MFVAAEKVNMGEHRFRQTSTKEYYDLCGFNLATEKRRRWKQEAGPEVNKLIDDIPSLKTHQSRELWNAILYRITHFFTIAAYYDRDWRFNVLKLKSYKGRQKGLNEIARRLTFGSQKYGCSPTPLHTHMVHPKARKKLVWTPTSSCDKPEEDHRHHYIIAFGNASWGNVRGKMPAPSKRLLGHLKNLSRLQNRLISVVMIDEYLTSQICAHCHQRSLQNVKERPSSGGDAGPSIHAVLKCDNCSTVWNRDRMAAKNMAYIFKYMALHNDERPLPFRRRPKETLNTEDLSGGGA
jgi:hypothetical protein